MTRWGPRTGFGVVAKIGKLKITLEDGSEWNMRGRAWGREGNRWDFDPARIEPHKPEHDKQIEKQRRAEDRAALCRKLESYRWLGSDLPLETLRAVEALLEKGTEKGGEHG